MKPFFVAPAKAIAAIEPMTAAVISAATLGVFAFIYVTCRFFYMEEKEDTSK